MNTEKLWKDFLKEISEQLTVQTFNIWFKDFELQSINNNVITILVKMEVQKINLMNKWYNFMEEILYNLTNENFEIRIYTNEEFEEEKNNLNINNADIFVDNFETNLNPNLNFNNFVVGNTNRLAYVSARAVAESPGKIHNPLFIYGKSGLGKTHLMHAIGNYIVENSDKKVLYVTCEDFMTDYTGIADLSKNSNSLEYANEFKNKYRNIDVLIIDDIQYLVGADKTQQEFFNTFNALHKAGKQIIISSDKSPDDLKRLKKD